MPMGTAMAVVRVKAHIRNGHKVKSYTRGSVKETVKSSGKQYAKTGSTGNKTLDKTVDRVVEKALSKIHPKGKALVKLYRGGEKVGGITAKIKFTRDEKRRKKK